MIKSGLKKIASLFGYEIRKKSAVDIFTMRNNFTDAVKHLRTVGYRPDLIIDVGAADGTPPLQDVFSGSTFFWVEPLNEFEPALKKLQQNLNGNYIISGVGSNEGSFVLNVHKDLHGSTLFEETDGETSDGTPREIPVTTLNNLAKKNEWNNFKKILLKADVQGFELEVIKGADEILSNVDVIILEVSLFRFLKNAPDFYEIIVYMKDLGYVVYDIIGGINRPLDLALGQKDLVFVKENGLFRKSHGWAK